MATREKLEGNMRSCEVGSPHESKTRPFYRLKFEAGFGPKSIVEAFLASINSDDLHEVEDFLFVYYFKLLYHKVVYADLVEK